MKSHKKKAKNNIFYYSRIVFGAKIAAQSTVTVLVSISIGISNTAGKLLDQKQQ